MKYFLRRPNRTLRRAETLFVFLALHKRREALRLRKKTGCESTLSRKSPRAIRAKVWKPDRWPGRVVRPRRRPNPVRRVQIRHRVSCGKLLSVRCARSCRHKVEDTYVVGSSQDRSDTEVGVRGAGQRSSV